MHRHNYVKCILILVSFNGGTLDPSSFSEQTNTPIIYWSLTSCDATGVEIPRTSRRRRRLAKYTSCDPFLYQIPHNPNSSLTSYSD